jgi:hypothetical protein
MNIETSAIECSEEEAVARLRAALAKTPELKREHRRIARRWRQLAAAYAEARRVSGFLEWRSRRLND